LERVKHFRGAYCLCLEVQRVNQVTTNRSRQQAELRLPPDSADSYLAYSLAKIKTVLLHVSEYTGVLD
jgi:hypothetical protein